jgi:hypothetical protein
MCENLKIIIVDCCSPVELLLTSGTGLSLFAFEFCGVGSFTTRQAEERV